MHEVSEDLSLLLWQNLASRTTTIILEWQLCWEFTFTHFSTKNPKSFNFAAFLCASLQIQDLTLCCTQKKIKSKMMKLNEKSTFTRPIKAKQSTLESFLMTMVLSAFFTLVFTGKIWSHLRGFRCFGLVPESGSMKHYLQEKNVKLRVT